MLSKKKYQSYIHTLKYTLKKIHTLNYIYVHHMKCPIYLLTPLQLYSSLHTCLSCASYKPAAYNIMQIFFLVNNIMQIWLFTCFTLLFFFIQCFTLLLVRVVFLLLNFDTVKSALITCKLQLIQFVFRYLLFVSLLLI